MIWKVIGQSVIGSSHIQAGKTCEDAVHYQIANAGAANEVLIGFVSDGAGSAQHAAKAAQTAVKNGVWVVNEWLENDIEIDENHLLQLAEAIYEDLAKQAFAHDVAVNEFSCTLLGFVIFEDRACFMQIGDGAIIRNDDEGYFSHIWWPHNGEYQNTTTFLIDDPHLPNLKTKIIDEVITEVAIFTDGLQMLALNNETERVHQPFFNDLFKWLRMATDDEHIAILNNKLTDYLNGPIINNRTDDDKTLLLATRLKHDRPGI